MNANLKEPSIYSLGFSMDVAPLLEQIHAHPEVWNVHRQRLDQYGSPHQGVSDIWCRYNAWENYTGDWLAFIRDEHESVWYPAMSKIPAIWSMSRKLKRLVGGKELGGVLITKIPPGGQVAPHIDGGWHAGYYRKYAVQLMGNKDQRFWFEDAELRAEPGEVYTFDNSRLHAVYNDSDTDRMTAIVCIR